MDKLETKITYVYDSNGKYVGSLTLDYTDRSQISGAWQIPGNTTLIAPGAEKNGYDRYWAGKAWEYREVPKVVEPETPTYTESTNKMPTIDERIAALEAYNLSQMGV